MLYHSVILFVAFDVNKRPTRIVRDSVGSPKTRLKQQDSAWTRLFWANWSPTLLPKNNCRSTRLDNAVVWLSLSGNRGTTGKRLINTLFHPDVLDFSLDNGFCYCKHFHEETRKVISLLWPLLQNNAATLVHTWHYFISGIIKSEAREKNWSSLRPLLHGFPDTDPVAVDKVAISNGIASLWRNSLNLRQHKQNQNRRVGRCSFSNSVSDNSSSVHKNNHPANTVKTGDGDRSQLRPGKVIQKVPNKKPTRQAEKKHSHTTWPFLIFSPQTKTKKQECLVALCPALLHSQLGVVPAARRNIQNAKKVKVRKFCGGLKKLTRI